MTGKQFRRMRQALDLTQVQLAREMGVTSNSVALWERGERPIRQSMARLLTLLTVLRHHKSLARKRQRGNS